MNIKDVIHLVENVKLYDKGTAVMWTDEHISNYLLEAHLNPDINMASRKPGSIEKILNFILKESGNNVNDVLDLGCGPGLYTQKLATKGYNVTGLDFSQNSINYATKQAKEHDLNIKYICQNYLDIDYHEQFDLIIMIYCDFGVLSSEERERLVTNIYKALKPGGYFIFDGLNEKTVLTMNFNKEWSMEEGGFWSKEPYVCLSQSLHFKENNALLDQHVVFTEDNSYKLYRFWNHYFNKADLQKEFNQAGFKEITEYSNLLENDGLYNDEGVSFYRVQK